ncbi:MAG: hypothetical protein KAS32_12185 [Candidatus Peribacteraceae bacterium]|nr:hypothetical protein [Candidatus Peribacteraceae bacterium]
MNKNRKIGLYMSIVLILVLFIIGIILIGIKPTIVIIGGTISIVVYISIMLGFLQGRTIKENIEFLSKMF